MTAIQAGAVSEMSDLLGGELLYCKFDETSGTTVIDSSGSGTNGTILGAATRSTNLPPTLFANTRSLEFTAATGAVDFGNILSLGQMSVSAWIRLPAISAIFYIAGRMGGSGNRGHQFFVRNTNRTLESVNYIDGSGDNVLVSPNSAIPLNTWCHVANTKALGDQRLFIDGVQVASSAHTGTAFDLSTESFRVHSGFSTNNTTSTPGFIDDLRVFSRILTPAEIANLAAGGPFATSRRRRSRSGGGVI
jgi:hypothetical protein